MVVTDARGGGDEVNQNLGRTAGTSQGLTKWRDLKNSFTAPYPNLIFLSEQGKKVGTSQWFSYNTPTLLKQ